jgi:lipoprotein-anchoring transpeptidase ErfK/SrfK
MSAAQGDHDAASTRVTVTATTQDWDRGMRGPQVAALVAELKRLNFHTPPATSLYGKRVSDVVLAFQKWNRLPRTAAMNNKTWDALSTAQPVQPTTRGKGVRIEVDKTRQVASLIRDDDVLGVLHVSTGLTGNTPEGRFRIYEKGVGSLFRFMGFYGNFGLHGYIPVPKYPASHGCVREPMWIADWTYRRAPIGTPVIIYRS